MFKDLPSNPHPPQIQKHLPGSIHVRLPMSKHIINQSSSLFYNHTSSISIWILHLHILNNYDYPSLPESSTVPCPNAPQHLAVQESKASSDQRITGAVEDLPPLAREWDLPRRCNMGVPAECFCWPIMRATPPACPHHFSEDIEGRVKLYIQRNLQHVSTEFRGNHQIRTPVKLYIQGNFQGV